MSDWDYKHPINVWESMPWFIRWPLAVFGIVVAIFFLTAPLHPWIKHSHGHTSPSARPGPYPAAGAMRLRCSASAYTQGTRVVGQSPGLHEPMQRVTCRSCLGCEHSAEPRLFRRKSLREGEVPARFCTGISRSWRGFVAGSIGAGPGWKICVAKVNKFYYITATDRDFSVPSSPDQALADSQSGQGLRFLEHSTNESKLRLCHG